MNLIILLFFTVKNFLNLFLKSEKFLTLVKYILKFIKTPWFEAVLWLIALLYLLVYNPFQQSEFSFCVLDNLGFEHCPGCGLGRSISYLLHGEIAAAWETHKMGMFALVAITFRIIQISVNQLRLRQKNQAQLSSR